MRNFSKKLNLNTAAWSFAVGLMLIGLLGACAKVNVVVDNCPSGSRVITEPPPAGGCNKGPILTVATNADGAFINTSPPQLISDGHHFCNAGTNKCASVAGTCVRKPCVVKFTPDSPGSMTGACDCACQWY